jgi:hypothetical protein
MCRGRAADRVGERSRSSTRPVGQPQLACGPGHHCHPIGSGAVRTWCVAGNPHAPVGGDTGQQSHGSNRRRGFSPCRCAASASCTEPAPPGVSSPHDHLSGHSCFGRWSRMATRGTLEHVRSHRWQPRWRDWPQGREQDPAGDGDPRRPRRPALFGEQDGAPPPGQDPSGARHGMSSVRVVHPWRTCPLLVRGTGSRRAIVGASNAASPVRRIGFVAFARPAATSDGSSRRIEPCRWKGSRKAARGAGSNSERETEGKRGTAMMTHLVIASSLAADREGRWKARAGASNPYDARPVSPILCSPGQRDERRRRRW